MPRRSPRRPSGVVIRFPVERTRPPAGSAPKFAPLIDRIAELWNSLPDEHPMFDGGRELLASMGRDSNGEPL